MKNQQISDTAILSLIDAVERGGHGLEIHPSDPANPGFGNWDVLIYTWGRSEPQRFHGESLAHACGKAFAWFRT